LESMPVRRLCSLLVVSIGWPYLLPQFQGAGIALTAVTGAPSWVGGLIVAVVVIANVVAGGMRSITLVQAMQYWLKLTAISIHVFVLLWLWLRHGAPQPNVPATGLPQERHDWSRPLSGFGGRDHPVYAMYSTLLALCFGTMGLPHVVVRFYTNPDGRAARQTTLVVVGLLGLFYVFTPVYGVLGRVYLPSLPQGVSADSVVLMLPTAISPGVLGELLSALLAGGAFAAFLSTASGLTISVAGVLNQDLLHPWISARTGGDSVAVPVLQGAAGGAVLVPYAVSPLSVGVGLADTVGLAFAVAASTFCPLLVLGVWWRGLSTAGAATGLVTGGLLVMSAVLVTVAGGVQGGWVGALVAQPAAWTVPIAFLVTVMVSLATPSRIPKGTARTMVRLHTPEDLALNRSPG